MDCDNAIIPSGKDDVDYESHCQSFPAPLRTFLQLKPKKACIRMLITSLRYIYDGDDKLKAEDFWSIVKTCYVLAGQLALHETYSEAMVVCLVIGFLEEFTRGPPRSADEYMAMNDSDIIYEFMLYHLYCDKLSGHKDETDMKSCIAAVIGQRHPNGNQWYESFGFKSERSTFWTKISIDGGNGNKYELEIPQNTTLGMILSAYTRDCSVVAKTCRQVQHNGRFLFTSIHWTKELRDIGIQDNCVIKVGNRLPCCQLPLPDVNIGHRAKSKENPKNKINKRKPKSCRTKKERKQTYDKTQIKNREPTMTECKEEHSKALGRVLDEARDKLERIRNELNNLEMKRTKPKKRVKRAQKAKPNKKDDAPNHFQTLHGGSDYEKGKAGRKFYPILVGEKTNLYKSGKGKEYKISTSNKVITLDLHGRTSKQSLEILDESVKKWVDNAMKESYPHVVAVDIVCGAGSQVSDVVRGWISRNRNVAIRRAGRS